MKTLRALVKYEVMGRICGACLPSNASVCVLRLATNTYRLLIQFSDSCYLCIFH